MKRILLALCLLAAATASAGEVFKGNWGEADTFNFVLYNTDGTLDVDEADGGTEVTLYCDEAAGVTATADFADEGPYYSIAVSAAEMRCKRLAVDVAATDRSVFFINTRPEGAKHYDLMQSYSAPDITLAAAAFHGDNTLTGNLLRACSATLGYCQERRIASNVESTDVVTLESAFDDAPTGATMVTIYPTFDTEQTGCLGLTANECIAFKTFAGIGDDDATPNTPSDGILIDTYTLAGAVNTTIEDGVPVISYINAAGDACTFTISESTPNLTPVCVEAP